MKRNNISLLLLLIPFTLFSCVGCSSKEKLLLLNWGEYINPEVITIFEERYNCNVIESIADSNELFYAKVKSGTTVYDLVVPSDYMVEKMVQNDLLQKIDYSLLTNYTVEDNPLMPGVLGIMNDMEMIMPGVTDYMMPYFWGTFGLMYNKQKVGLAEAINEYGWATMFEEDKTPDGTKVGMYSVPRFAFASCMFYQNQSPNIPSDEMLEKAKNALSQRKFTEWGNDTLKKGVVAGNLDLAFVYTGDFLDMLYTKLSDGNTFEDITFDIYIPNDTIAFVDSLVIPKKARHVDLAHKFIDFMLEQEIAYLNASVVGYCTPIIAAYNQIVNYQNDDTNPDNEWLNNWGIAVSKYYPLPKPTDLKPYKGIPLANFDHDYLNKITMMINNIKVS